MARPALEDILQQTREKGPRVISELGIRLDVEEAEQLSAGLRAEGMDVAPYDFPNTFNIWKALDSDGVPYKILATKQLIRVLAEREKVDFRTVEGFREILPYLTSNAFEVAISRWGTRLNGMLNAAYDGAPSAAALDLVRTDKEFAKIRQKNLQPYDFPTAPQNMWKDKDGKPTEMARAATKQLIKLFAKKLRVDYTTLDGFRQILPNLTNGNFREMPINIWGTNLNGMLQDSYGGSAPAAVLDLVSSDKDFAALRRYNLQPYDFKQAPNNTWKDKDGRPTETARAATKLLITYLAQRQGVDFRTVEGFRKILPELVRDSFKEAPINEWGTTLSGLLATHGSVSGLVFELLNNDDEFTKIKNVNLQPYDFLHAPPNTWQDEQGNFTATARAAVKQLIVTLAKQAGVDYRTFEGFRQILPNMNEDTFHNIAINEWGTTLGGLLRTPFKSIKPHSISTFVSDLISKDEEFAEIRKHNLQPYDFLHAPNNTWVGKDGKPTEVAREVLKKFIRVLAEQKGVNYMAFRGFKKILSHITRDSLASVQISDWGTTPDVMLRAYDGRLIEAVLDLVSKDPEFKHLRGRINENILKYHRNTRESRADGKYSLHTISASLTNLGINLSDYGFYTFSSGEKQSARETLARAAKERFGEQHVAYFGLEGPSFGSYFALSQAVKINAKKSMIPERNRRHYNVMAQIKNMVSVNRTLNGNSLRPLELILSSAEEALQNTEKKFDLVFLDWLGFLSPAGMREMEQAYQHLNDNGMIAVTLNMHELHEDRYRRLSGRQDSQDEYVQQWAQQHDTQVTYVDYVGGEKKRMPMRMYLLKKQL